MSESQRPRPAGIFWPDTDNYTEPAWYPEDPAPDAASKQLFGTPANQVQPGFDDAIIAATEQFLESTRHRLINDLHETVFSFGRSYLDVSDHFCEPDCRVLPVKDPTMFTVAYIRHLQNAVLAKPRWRRNRVIIAGKEESGKMVVVIRRDSVSIGEKLLADHEVTQSLESWQLSLVANFHQEHRDTIRRLAHVRSKLPGIIAKVANQHQGVAVAAFDTGDREKVDVWVLCPSYHEEKACAFGIVSEGESWFDFIELPVSREGIVGVDRLIFPEAVAKLLHYAVPAKCFPGITKISDSRLGFSLAIELPQPSEIVKEDP